MNELVSIITPSYNTASFIGQTIESVLSQTYQNWEMIIVDDCSSDDTDEIVREYLFDERIKYIKNDSNSGAAISRNRALREARGKWIAFLDSDDLWDSNKLEEQIYFMESKRIHFSYTNYEEIDENGQSTEILVSGPKILTSKRMENYCYPGCLTVMYDASLIDLIQISDIKKNNDYAIWLKISKNYDCHLLNKNLAKYRRRSGSISNSSIYTLIIWHYKLWREAENRSPLWSLYLTMKNIIFGIQKKILYKSRGNR